MARAVGEPGEGRPIAAGVVESRKQDNEPASPRDLIVQAKPVVLTDSRMAVGVSMSAHLGRCVPGGRIVIIGNQNTVAEADQSAVHLAG
jgi:hypothetical protein